MKIKETIERDCCQNSDLVEFPHQPRPPGKHRYYFCKHCGRPWTTESYMDAAGGKDTRNVPLPWPFTHSGQWIVERTDNGHEVVWNLTKVSVHIFSESLASKAHEMAQSLNQAMHPHGTEGAG